VLDALNEILGRFIFPANADGTDPRKCPSCANGQLGLKIGRYGAFVGCTNYPECRFTRQFDKAQGEAGEGAQATPGDKELGPDPETGVTIFLKTGRFGPYVQLGAGDNGDKPKRASIPKGMSAATLDLEAAIKLLSLPRLVGVHPETGKPITANIGRYGPYVEHDGKYANLDGPEEVFEVGINRAVAVLAEPKKREGRGAAQTALKKLGDHPELGGTVQVMAGRYGPYVKHGKVNATIPKSIEPEALTMEEAVKLLAARAESGKTGKSAKTTKAKGGATKTKKAAPADKDAKPAKATKTTKSAKPKSKGKGASQTASEATS
jgi:DNA topoisomerase-1